MPPQLPVAVSTPKIFVATPAYGQIITAQTTSTIVALTRELMLRDLAGGFGTLSYPDIVEIRNIFLSIWYDKIKTSHMLFIDADMSFDPAIVLDMITFKRPLNDGAMTAPGVVGAVCPKKKYPLEFAGRAKLGDSRIINNFMEVDGVGGAIMMIRRDVIDTMIEKFPDLVDNKSVKNHAAKDLLAGQGVTRLLRFFDKMVIEDETFSEDLSFCHRWHQCGGDVWGNIGYPITHVGMHEFTGKYHDMIKDHIRPGGPLPLATQSSDPVAVIKPNGSQPMQAAE